MVDAEGKKVSIGTALQSIESPENCGLVDCIEIKKDVATFERRGVSGSFKTFKIDRDNLLNSQWRVK